MSDSSLFMKWSAGCKDTGAYGISHGDTFHCGLRNYSEPFPCPNGLPIDRRLPRDVAWHRERIGKARKFAIEYSKEIRIREAAELLKPKQIEEDIKEIREWLTSVFTVR